MEHYKYLLKSENPSVELRGGYFKDFIYYNSTAVINNGEKGRPHFFFKEDLSRDEFERNMLKEIKKNRPLSYVFLILRNRIGSILTILMSILIIVFISLLAIHGSMTYDLFSGNDNGNILGIHPLYLYLSLTLLILLMLYFSPKIILGEFNNLLEWVESKLSSDKKIRKQLYREINKFLEQKMDAGLSVVNPLVQGSDSWIIKQLMPELLLQKTTVSFYIKTDEKNEMVNLLQKSGVTLLPEETENENTAGTDRLFFPLELLIVREKESLSLIAYCSLLNLPSSWKKDKIYFSQDLFGVLSASFNDNIYSTRNGMVSVERFITRCVSDYGYLFEEHTFGNKKLLINDQVLKTIKVNYSLNDLKDKILSSFSSVINKVEDPHADLILIG